MKPCLRSSYLKKRPLLGKVGSMHRTFLILLFLVIPITALHSQTTSVIAVSPDKKFQLLRQQGESTDRGEARKVLSLCNKEGKILYQWTSGLGTTTALWSPDGHFVAINDMPGEKGDLLRIFALDPATPSVTPLRDPDGKNLRREVETRHGSFLSKVDAVTLRASEWKEGRLWCLLTGTFSPKRQASVHVPFHHLWVFKLEGTNAPLLQEEWTLTDPREKSYRDSDR
jgi:hypothetical protein